MYPRQLAALQSRGELLEALRRQQEDLQAALMEEEEEEQVDEERQSLLDLVRYNVAPNPEQITESAPALFLFYSDCWVLFMKDSLEDELSTCNESVGTEPSFVDENLVFNESRRVPFFKVSTVQRTIPAAQPQTFCGGASS